MSKMRSPNYPSVSLPVAIQALSGIWEKEKRTIVPGHVAANAIGYTSLSGPARSKLAALKKFGLLDDNTNGMQISDLGLKVLHAQLGTDEHDAAIRQAATTPSLFSELLSSHSQASESAVKSYLILNKGFSDDGARIAARTFRETFEFAKLGEQDYAKGAATGKASPDLSNYGIGGPWAEKPGAGGAGGSMVPATFTGVNSFSLAVPFGGASLAVTISLQGQRLTQAHLARVRKYLELAEEDLPTSEQAGALDAIETETTTDGS